jgi:heavy metal sensor kinase
MMALSLAVFGVITYTSVSNELYTNLDASLNQVIASLDVIIREQSQSSASEEKVPSRERVKDGKKDTSDLKSQLAFLRKDSTSTDSAIKPAIRPLQEEPSKGKGIEVAQKDVDPVWTAIYEHIVLNSRNFIIQIMDTSGHIVWRSANLTQHNDSLTLPPAFVNQARDSIAHFTTISQAFRDGKEAQSFRVAIARSGTAVIAASYPSNEVQTLLEEFFSLLVLLVPAVLIFSIFGGWLLARASLRPVDELTRTAQDITASNLSRRLPVPNTNDEVGRLSETLNNMISRLESSFDQIRQFTADASHELRTPLTILTGELELALRTNKRPDEYQDILSSALTETLRLSRVVEYLLLLSRTDMGQISLQLEPMNLTETLADLADATTVLGTPKHIYITYRHGQEDLIINADQAKLYQMLLNLVDNAVKYTPEGGLISITLHRDGGFAEVRVRDTGIGISLEHQKKIFNRFYRVDKARSRELGGTGLGLSIVQWTVHAHGGTIVVESEPGQGSTFIVRLPLAAEKDRERQITAVTTQKQKHRGLSQAFDVTRFRKKPKAETTVDKPAGEGKKKGK